MTPEEARAQLEQINQLKTEFASPRGGNLATLAANIRSLYLHFPAGTIPATEVQMLVEGFLTEIETLRREHLNSTFDLIERADGLLPAAACWLECAEVAAGEDRAACKQHLHRAIERYRQWRSDWFKSNPYPFPGTNTKPF